MNVYFADFFFIIKVSHVYFLQHVNGKYVLQRHKGFHNFELKDLTSYCFGACIASYHLPSFF